MESLIKVTLIAFAVWMLAGNGGKTTPDYSPSTYGARLVDAD